MARYLTPRRERQPSTRENYRPMRREPPLVTPIVDLCEMDDGFELTAALPGVDESKVDITVEGNVLTIRGASAQDSHEGFNLLYREYEPRTYEWSFNLAEPVDRDRITADMKNGLLHLVVPKSEKAKLKKIEVKTG